MASSAALVLTLIYFYTRFNENLSFLEFYCEYYYLKFNIFISDFTNFYIFLSVTFENELNLESEFEYKNAEGEGAEDNLWEKSQNII
jgi:hypothetical protein